MGTNPWYSFHDGDCFEVTLKNGEVFKYKHVGATETGQAKVEIQGAVKTVNEIGIFHGRNIAGSQVRKIKCAEL